MKKVACVGILVTDIIVEPVSTYPKSGELTQVNSITMHNGGNAMTASINIHNLGVDTYIVGKIGDDYFGKFLKDKFVAEGINTDGLKVDSNCQTSASVLMLDGATGERSFFHCTGGNAAFSINDVDFDIIEKSDLVFVTGSFLLDNFDGEETMEFLKKCKEMGKTTFLDVCWDAKGNWGKLLNMSMPYIDWFMPSIDEAVNIAEWDDIEDVEGIANVFLKNGVKNTVIKVGSKGAYLKQGTDEVGTLYPAYKGIKAIDTTGAGDSFCSGFLAAFARGMNPVECTKFANATGAACVQAIGATTGIESYDKIIEFMEAHK